MLPAPLEKPLEPIFGNIFERTIVKNDNEIGPKYNSKELSYLGC